MVHHAPKAADARALSELVKAATLSEDAEKRVASLSLR
jgi:hypothetical protein